MSDVITTIGDRAAETINITNVTGTGPYTVTLGSATTTTDDGDSLSDESSPAGVYRIVSGAGTDTLVVEDSTGEGSGPAYFPAQYGSTERYYSTIATWESDLDNSNLYASGNHAVGHLMADSDHEEKNNDINGGGTVGLDKVTLTVPAGERHDGTHDTGAKIKLPSNSLQAIKCKAQFIPVELSWFEVDVNDKGHYGVVNCIGNTANAPVVHHLIVHNSSGASGANAIMIGAGAATGLVVHNCAVYNVSANGTRSEAGIQGKTTKVFEVYNCSVLSITQTGAGSANGVRNITDDADHVVQNTISVDATDDCFDDDLSPSNATLTNNIASDTSNDGHTNSVSSESAGDLFESILEGSEDLRLKSGTNSAVAAGVDLSSLSYTDIEIDVTGVTRSGDWDIGADQRVAEVTTALPAAMNTYQQMVR